MKIYLVTLESVEDCDMSVKHKAFTEKEKAYAYFKEECEKLNAFVEKEDIFDAVEESDDSLICYVDGEYSENRECIYIEELDAE